MLLFNKIVYKHSQWITSKSGKYYCAESSWLIQNSQEEMWPKMYTIKKIAKYFFLSKAWHPTNCSIKYLLYSILTC